MVLDEAYFPETLNAVQVGKILAKTYRRWDKGRYDGYLDRFSLPRDKQFKDFSREDLVVVSPDLGSVTRARKFADRLGAPIAIIDKRRPRPNVSEVMNIIGDVQGKTCIIVDDIIDTAGTICNAAAALVERGGAKEVYGCATHGVLSGPAIERIENSVFKEMVLLDTIPVRDNSCKKIVQLPVAPLFADAIERIYEDQPVSPLFN